MEDKSISFSDQISSVIELTGSSTIIIVVLAVFCILLGILIARLFANIWHSQTLKRRFFLDLINRYEVDIELDYENEDASANRGLTSGYR